MALTISEQEMDLCRQLMRPGWIAAGLTNDLFSWKKEYDAARQAGQQDVVNAIWVLMREHSITAEEAKQMCRKIIKESTAEYLRIEEENRNNMNLSLDLRKYLESMKYTLSGNVVWSLLCPRYNPEATFNARQIKRMKYGLSKELPQFLTQI